MGRINKTINIESSYQRACSWVLTLTFALLPLVFWPTARNPNLAKPLLLLIGLGFAIAALTLQAYKGQKLQPSFNLLDIAVGLYTILACSSWIYSDYRSATLQAIKVSLTYGILYFISRIILSSDRARARLVIALLCGCAIVSLVGIYEHFGNLPWGNPDQISSTFFNRTYLAAYLLTILPLAVWGLFNKKLVGTATLLTAMPALLFTSARIAWLALVPMAVIAVIAYWRLLHKNSKRIIAAAFALSILITIVLQFGVQKHSPISMISSALQLGSDKSNIERLALIKTAIRMGMARPALGWGAGTFMVYAPDYASHGCYVGVLQNSSVSGSVVMMHTHNEFLEVFSELGFLGLASFLLIPLAAGVVLLILLRREDISKTDKALAIALFISIAGFLISNMVGLSARVSGESGFMYIVLALLASIGQHRLSTEKHRHPIQVSGLIMAFLLIGAIGWSTIVELRASIYISKGEELLADPNNVYAAAEAANNFRMACRLTPNDPGVWYELGNAYAASGDPQKALKAYDIVGNLSPSYGRLHFNRATSMFNTGRYYDALYEMTIAHDQDGLPDSGERLNYLRKLLHVKP